MDAVSVTSAPDPRLHLLWWGYWTLAAQGWKHQRVSRPYWRLYWNSGPGASVWSGKSRFDLTPDAFLLISPNAMVSTANERPLEHLFIHFQISSGVLDHRPRMTSVALSPLLEGLRDQLLGVFASRQPSPWLFSLAMRSLVQGVLIAADLEHSSSLCSDPRLLAVMSHIDARLAEPLFNGELAQVAGMSVSSFNRRFKKELGYSVQDFIQIRRIERAGQLLESSRDSIESIAEKTGFCDRFYFSRIFKQKQGISPAAFRELHCEPGDFEIGIGSTPARGGWRGKPMK